MSLTNGIRMELSRLGTLVVAVHASFIDTDMAAGIDVPKISPESVARQTLDAVETGEIEVLADERSRFVKASLPRDHDLIYAPLQLFFRRPRALASGHFSRIVRAQGAILLARPERTARCCSVVRLGLRLLPRVPRHG